MADDIVIRLRQAPWTVAGHEAAEEIERLREQVQYRDDVISMLLEEARRG